MAYIVTVSRTLYLDEKNLLWPTLMAYIVTVSPTLYLGSKEPSLAIVEGFNHFSVVPVHQSVVHVVMNLQKKFITVLYTLS